MVPSGHGDATARRLDRFTARCRVPVSRIRARSARMSQYLLVQAAQSDAAAAKDTLFICRAAVLSQDEDAACAGTADDNSSFDGPLCFDPSVCMTARAPLFQTLGGVDVGFSADASCRSLQWIPKSSLCNGVAVTLEAIHALSDHVDAATESRADSDASQTRQRVRAWLANYEYRQMLHETLQRHLLLARGAIVQLPAPSGFADSSAATVAFRVVSVYPDEAFVHVTPTTRVTLTTADDSSGVDVAGNDAAPATDTTSSSVDSDTAPPKIGGLEKEQAALRDMILLPVENAELAERCGIEFPKGLLLCGPPGVGKTLLVRSVVHECRQRVPLHLQTINGAEIMTSGVGDAETALRRIFADAAAFARRTRGAGVLFIDELDALCPTREATSATAHSRVVAQLLTLLDGVDAHARANVIVVGATNLPNAIDPALRRPGRFDRELFVAPPSATERAKIFAINMQGMPIRGDAASSDGSEGVDTTARAAFIEALAHKAIGYVGADIAALCREALAVATTRQFVAMARDQELDAWWRSWKRQSKPLYNANFSAVVAGNAWTANPIAIPLWFVAKQQAQQHQAQQQQTSGGGAATRFFAFLLQRGAGDSSHSAKRDPAEEDAAQELEYAVLSPPEKVHDPTSFSVTMADFDQAMQVVVASSLRGASGFSKDFERLGWDCIGGQDATKLALQQALEWPIKYPQTFTRLGVKPPRGILLYGPPGCSKSTIVRAAAHSSGATFLTLSAAKVFSPFFGDAEAAVRQVFRDARAALPAIVFFDEIDVLVTKRAFDGSASGGDAGTSAAMRVMSTMLNEMDGVEAADGLLVIGATNRPDCIDAALLRPGRFDRILYVDLPTEADRLAILKIHTAAMHVADDVDLVAIASRTPMFSGAELENVCREAALHALRESIHAESVCMRHFDDALAHAAPGATPATIAQYHAFADAMGHLA